MSEFHRVLILDFGSQYTQLIARRVREQGIYSCIHPADLRLEKIEEIKPSAVVLSGGPASVYDDGAPGIPQGLLEYQSRKTIPILGICYGMQLLVKELGGKVSSADSREYGRMEVHRRSSSSIVEKERFEAWMSHGDEISSLPEGFELTYESASGTPAAIENRDKKILALQFHPEVTHTEGGDGILRKFLREFAGIPSDWEMKSVSDEQIEKIRTLVGKERHAICALSGGVDSAVAASLVHRALGDRLHCVFVDHGLLRYQERERVMKFFNDHLHLPVECVRAEERFLSKLSGVEDPEKKRKIIGAEFISVFEDFSKEVGRKVGHDPEFLVQGTLYPDVIESSPPPGGAGSKKFSTTIKSHHNVGGLPKDLKFKLIEPLRDLFKDEVRKLGRVLEVPSAFLNRHPFPGPGLAVRIIGEITRERIECLQLADEIYINAIREAGLYDEIWQAFAVFLPIKSVGVQGDGRTHDNVVALRAVTSKDGMTADWYGFSQEFLARVSNQISNEVRGINRVVYDVSSKPPATIEWE